MIHLLIIVLMALVGSGASAVQQEKMILEPLAKFWTKHFPRWIQDALWRCPICAVSVWGLPTALFLSLWYWGAPVGLGRAMAIYGPHAVLVMAPLVLPFTLIYLFASAGLSAYLNK